MKLSKTLIIVSRALTRASFKNEMWIESRALINRGWVATPKHAHGGRHAADTTRRGRRVLARVYSVGVAA